MHTQNNENHCKFRSISLRSFSFINILIVIMIESLNASDPSLNIKMISDGMMAREGKERKRRTTQRRPRHTIIKITYWRNCRYMHNQINDILKYESPLISHYNYYSNDATETAMLYFYVSCITYIYVCILGLIRVRIWNVVNVMLLQIAAAGWMPSVQIQWGWDENKSWMNPVMNYRLPFDALHCVYRLSPRHPLRAIQLLLWLHRVYTCKVNINISSNYYLFWQRITNEKCIRKEICTLFGTYITHIRHTYYTFLLHVMAGVRVRAWVMKMKNKYKKRKIIIKLKMLYINCILFHFIIELFHRSSPSPIKKKQTDVNISPTAHILHLWRKICECMLNSCHQSQLDKFNFSAFDIFCS